MIPPRCFSLLLLLLPAAGPCQDQEPPLTAEGLREDWLEKDREAARRTHAALALERPTVDRFRQALGIGATDSEPRDLGYGAKLFTRDLGGGYTMHWVRWVTFTPPADPSKEPRSRPKPQLVAVSVRATISHETLAKVRPHLLKIWGDARQVEKQRWGYSVRREYADAIRAQRGAREAVLGEATTRHDPPVSLAEGMDSLLDPLADHAVGEVCEYGGIVPIGHATTEALLEMGALDLLAILLRGPNPEARVYAARALLEARGQGADVPAADLATIAKIRALAIPVQMCRGCFFSDSTAAELLSGLPN